MKKLYLAWLICLMAFQVSAQQRWVTGVVADTNGVPVVGATVTVKGGTNGAITNSDGSFRIEASDSDILVFKYLGYDEQEIQVGPRTRIEIELRESAHQLDDVVVTGYQTISKERATGSFDIIDKAQLEKPSGSIASRLIGSAAGLVGTQDAYGNPVFEIRGRSSLSTSATEPLLGRRARGLHRHARRQALFHRTQLDPGHERREHRPQAGARHGHDRRGAVRHHHRRYLPQMIEIDDKIVSADLLRECFACDLAQCKGICCVEGNAGAPLEEDEVEILEREYPNYRSCMTPEGIEAVERQGFTVVDEEGDLTTPLVNDAECAYAYTENGVTLCAIEKAWQEGRTPFRKPISCHLYPIRLMRFSNGTIGLNYHRWSVCAPARRCGARLGIPVYKALREPIIRRFGPEFYQALEAAEALLKNK